MSILSQLLHHEITFATAANEVEAWAAKIVGSDPILTQAAGQLLSAAKQGASDAIMLADTQLGALIVPAASGLEAALDVALASATKGASVPLNPIMDAVIDQFARTAKAAADAWALKAKATLAAPAAPSA